MSGNPSSKDRWTEREAAWAFVARILAFFFGMFLIYQQSTMPDPPGAQESLIAVGAGFMGPFVVTALATALEKARKEPE